MALTWGLHEPQPVPARVASQTAFRLLRPDWTAATSAPFDTPLQLQIWASSGRSRRPTPGACNCNGVSKGAIVGALRMGCKTLKAVCDATRIVSGCS